MPGRRRRCRGQLNAVETIVHPGSDLRQHIDDIGSRRGGYRQLAAAKHLPRYLAEFDFRYSNRIALGVDDRTRADNALMGVVGKRLTYETVSARRPGEEVRIIW